MNQIHYMHVDHTSGRFDMIIPACWLVLNFTCFTQISEPKNFFKKFKNKSGRKKVVVKSGERPWPFAFIHAAHSEILGSLAAV